MGVERFGWWTTRESVAEGSGRGAWKCQQGCPYQGRRVHPCQLQLPHRPQRHKEVGLPRSKRKRRRSVGVGDDARRDRLTDLPLSPLICGCAPVCGCVRQACAVRRAGTGRGGSVGAGCTSRAHTRRRQTSCDRIRFGCVVWLEVPCGGRGVCGRGPTARGVARCTAAAACLWSCGNAWGAGSEA